MATMQRNKFWAVDSSDEEDQTDEKQQEGQKSKRPEREYVFDSDTESEEERRQVKSQAQRRAEELKETVRTLENHIQINDWNALFVDYENLNKALKRLQQTAKAGTTSTPRMYLRGVVALDNAVTAMTKAAQQKLSKTANTSFNKTRQALKKLLESLAAEVAAFKASPPDVESSTSESSSDSSSESESESESSSESESDSDSDSTTSSSSSSTSSTSSDSEDKPSAEEESDIDWSASSESSSSSDEEGAGQELTGRARWLKRVVTTKVESSKRERRQKRTAAAAAAVQVTETKEAAATKEDEWTVNVLEEKLMNIVAQRGRKGVDRRSQIESLRHLAGVSVQFGPDRLIPSLMHVISALFDTSASIDAHMSRNTWTTTLTDVNTVVEILNRNPNFVLGHLSSEEIGGAAALAAKKDTKNAAAAVFYTENSSDGKVVLRVVGSLVVCAQRLSDELNRAVRNVDPHTPEFLDRVRDEQQLVTLISKVLAYYERVNDMTTAASLALLRLEHMYYKHDSINAGQTEAAALPTSMPLTGDAIVSTVTPTGNPFLGSQAATTAEWVDELSKFVYRFGTTHEKTMALLYHIYYHSLHNRFHEARDLLLMSHLQDQIQFAEESAQVLFNRAMSQLGLCAFRKGLLHEAHSILSEICSVGRAKELLAQGISQSKYGERNLELEKQQRRRLVPFHMQINLEMLEACHLISAMLLEVPNMAAAEHDPRRRRISTTYRRFLEYLEKEAFVGPPENTRDSIMAAGVALASGNWRRCAELVTGLKVWALWENLGAAGIRSMLVTKVKEQALRTYMLTFGTHYESLKHDHLVEVFDMSLSEVHSLLSQMMVTNELSAAWDQPTNSLVMHRVEPSKLQSLALEFADKVSTLVESNERLMDARVSALGEEGVRRGNFRGRGRDRNRTGGPAGSSQGDKQGSSSGGRSFGYYNGGRGGRGGNRRGGGGRGGRGGYGSRY